MEIVIEESDETLFWLELIEETQIINEELELNDLKSEANELIGIFVSSTKTVKKRINHKS